MADDVTATEDAPAVAVDDQREALLAVFSEHLGDALVGTHIRPDRACGSGSPPPPWRETAEVARDKLGLRFFDFLSAIDWLPSPFGRYEDSQDDIPFPPPSPTSRRP